MMTPEERFWNKVDIGAEDECWLWTGSRLTNGDYGNVKWNGRTQIASRVVKEIVGDPIPAHLKACHSCDNPPCVNPNHIFAGTQLENLMDCMNKGRRNQVAGIEHGNAKLTDSDVLEIRRRAATENRIQATLARQYNVSEMQISKIVRRKAWTHI